MMLEKDCCVRVEMFNVQKAEQLREWMDLLPYLEVIPKIGYKYIETKLG